MKNKIKYLEVKSISRSETDARIKVALMLALQLKDNLTAWGEKMRLRSI